MFAEHTIRAIVALAAVDPGVTDDEKRRLDSLLSGTAAKTEIHPYVTYQRAASELHRSPSTIKRLVKVGRLRPVIGTGCRAIGISWDSMNEYLKGKVQN